MVARAVMRSVVEAVPSGVPDDGGSSVGVITFLNDTFTDTNGTLLTAHTMDTGPGWVASGSAGFEIQSNAATIAVGAGGLILANAGTANGVLRCTVSALNNMIAVRSTDGNNFIYVDTGSASALNIIERVAGADNIVGGIGFFAPSITYPAEFVITLSGTSITVNVTGNASATISGTTSNFAAVTTHGFRANTASPLTYDSFSFRSA